MRSWHIRLFVLVLSSFIGLPVAATIKNSGYVVGKPVLWTTENSDNMGSYLHYRIDVQIDPSNPADKRTAVINIREKTDGKPVMYKIHNIFSLSKFYGDVLGKNPGVYPLTMTTTGGVESEGAIDILRHQGLMNDTAGVDWKAAAIQSSTSGGITTYSIPEWDALFQNARKVFIFGELFTDHGGGAHRVHQNQGDTKASFTAGNGTWQDGAILIEYDPIKLQVPGLWVWLGGKWVYRPGTTLYIPNRKVLYKYMGPGKYNAGQALFTYTVDPDGSGPLKPGDAIPTSQIKKAADQNYTLSDGAFQDFGPLDAEQVEVRVVPQAGDMDVYVRKDGLASQSAYDSASVNSGTATEYVRRFGHGQYYVRVKAKNGASTAKVTIAYY